MEEYDAREPKIRGRELIRIEFPGAVYHVTARGDGRQAIFRDDADREYFLVILDNAVSLRTWVCHAYCLMGSDYTPGHRNA